METTFWIWLAIIVVSLIIEIVTLDLVSIWFSFGAVVPFILSAIGGIPIEIQIVVFFLVSALMIVFLRKYAQKWLFKGMNLKTNTDALLGKTYRLLEKTDFETSGLIKINDVVWKAVGENGELIEKGQLVEVVRIAGNKMIVRKSLENKETEVQSEENKHKYERDEESYLSAQEEKAAKEDKKQENSNVIEEGE